MGYREVGLMQVVEVRRRWQAGESADDDAVIVPGNDGLRKPNSRSERVRASSSASLILRELGDPGAGCRSEPGRSEGLWFVRSFALLVPSEGMKRTPARRRSVLIRIASLSGIIGRIYAVHRYW
jgi:hypothetical protein